MSCLRFNHSTKLEEIPNGGYGWVCVASQFLINAFTWGTVASYSVYLAYYLSHETFPDAGTLDFAYIGGLNFSMAMLVAPLTNLATRLAGVKLPMSLGIALFSGGWLAGSFSSKIWHLYLFQGVFVGFGVGLIWVPANAIIPQWFTTKRSLANGICAAGSGIGGLIMCFSTEAMLSSLGLAWTMRITAAIVFAVLVLATVLIQPCNTNDQAHQHMFDWHLLKRYRVLLLLAWSLVIMFGYITLMFSLSDYTLWIGKSQTASATVAAVLNLGCAVGRPFIGFISDRYGRIRVAGIVTFVCSLLVFTVWLPTKSFAALLLFAFTGGAVLGIFWVAIGPLAADVVDLRDVTSFLSLSSLTVVLPCSFAEAIALQLRRPNVSRSYLYPQIFAGISYFLGAFIMFELWRVSPRKTTKSLKENNNDV